MQSNITVAGLTPVESKRLDNTYEASVWNRKYTISDTPFFSSIISGGQEILAGPIKLVCKCKINLSVTSGHLENTFRNHL